ncbi:WXG100 family type VII secretion target [Mycolicibacterium mucogenicum]|jgi:WXG100 family type VII secretion target|uniref:WXG100 family type VII secretion target n=1 Tax=Mycolicibacterium TaxID=1866885 RepID=UPI0022698574|nr:MULTISPECIES: WXG100 family type VII secretion target [Mycolicibacterium]MCX8562578.1 WXG100 family type VII secretion target [Mycolicibacterium mucogenicum]
MFVVDPDQLTHAADDVEAFHNKVKSVLEEVERTMTTLRASWHGEASDAQAQAQQQWKTGAEQMDQSLQALKKVLTAAQKNYSDAVKNNGQMWGGT